MVPVNSSKRSDRVVFPWSMWAMMQKLRVLADMSCLKKKGAEYARHVPLGQWPVSDGLRNRVEMVLPGSRRALFVRGYMRSGAHAKQEQHGEDDVADEGVPIEHPSRRKLRQAGGHRLCPSRGRFHV